jgi:(p)ppGpp synthase/HD superfamily hydrolase
MSLDFLDSHGMQVVRAVLQVQFQHGFVLASLLHDAIHDLAHGNQQLQRLYAFP